MQDITYRAWHYKEKKYYKVVSIDFVDKEIILQGAPVENLDNAYYDKVVSFDEAGLERYYDGDLESNYYDIKRYIVPAELLEDITEQANQDKWAEEYYYIDELLKQDRIKDADE